ncbi:MAG TPA: response regulator [Patescibacteria group bacterium]|nr:response regulator [Patescibacteria group bacterium]
MEQVPLLIVDDDEDITDLFKMTLKYEGFDVETAKSGQEALEKASKKKFNIALLDIMLPDMMGDTVAERLKKIDDSMEIIFVTGYSHLEDCIDATKIGLCEILLKPVTNDELMRALKSALASYRG